MKILKVTLQNINSLKSEFPIVIDFEAEQFTDIGLYAITGSTGAGKTTILDAITIALYHEVPRFNATNVRAGLVDVVSYGSSQASSTVVFENKGKRYEALWSIRLVSKAGKKLVNPQEEVRLKNLTTNRIIAEKKREVQTKIEEVTQLDYHQFLRSVMLAQGEFAAFLSAKGSEKAKLLEQITGEEIYKKIGEVITQRSYEERKKLEKIQAKVNSEDLLSNEKRRELKIEEEETKARLQQIFIELAQVEKRVLWYTKSAELLKEESLLRDRCEALDQKKSESQLSLNKLKLHENAEPFSQMLQTIERITKESAEKKNELERIAEELIFLDPKTKNAQVEEKKLRVALQREEKELKRWLPQLEKVSQLDTSITKEKENKRKLETVIEEGQASIVKLQKLQAEAQVKREQKLIKANKIKAFINQYPKLPEIEKELTAWNTQLTTLEGKKEQKNQGLTYCRNKEVELLEKQERLEMGNSFLLEKKEQLKESKQDLLNLKKQLKERDFNVILQEKDIKDAEYRNWTDFKERSLDYQKANDERVLLLKKHDTLIRSKKQLDKKQEALVLQLGKAKVSLNDAEKILDLERTIKDFDKERRKLKKGEPCTLCGATEHPFVEKYKEVEIIKSQKVVDDRKAELDELISADVEVKNELTKRNTQVESNFSRISEWDATLEALNENALKLRVEISIEDLKGIELKQKTLKVDCDRLHAQLEEATKLKDQKELLEQSCQDQKETVNKYQARISVLQESIKNLKKEHSDKKEEVFSLELTTSELKEELKSSLSRYELTLPNFNESVLFIDKLANQVADFNTKKKSLVLVENEISEIELQLRNIAQQASEKEAIQKVQSLESAALLQKVTDLMANREVLLPFEMTVDAKRQALLTSRDDAKFKSESSKEEVSKFYIIQTEKTSQKSLIEKTLATNEKELIEYQSDLETQINTSGFIDKEQVRKALLSKEEKADFTKLKTDIDNKTVELHTLKSKLASELKSLEKQKNFESSEEDAREQQIEIKRVEESLIKRSGELSKQFDLDNQIKERNQSVFQEIEIQDKELQKWRDLITLLGGSKDAFNTYVQRLTLKNLIGFANLHLYKLNRRYALVMEDTYKTGEELNFKLVDHYQTDETRYVDTSSGGEKFLISLSLALGLSDLASNNVKIDSLFIDEGFGTLDNNSLEIVISTLETLQEQGKMIGIISHVENLKERIPTQIQVSKRSNGISVVDIV